MVDFIEEQFPPKISYGSSGGPGFKTSLFYTDSGRVSGISHWDSIKAIYDVNLDFVDSVGLAAVQNHFYMMRGRAIGFRFKDWSDYKVSNQNFFVGDGVATTFQFFKRYRSAQYRYDRVIKKLVSGSLGVVTVSGVTKTEGVDFTVDYNTGVFTFNAAPAKGTVGRVAYVEYDVPCRYDIDYLDFQVSDFNQYVAASIPIIEILL